METCLFCGADLHVLTHGEEIVWVGSDGSDACFSFGTGPHYPGKEADLFWRGSGSRGVVIDLTSAGTVVVLGDRLDSRFDEPFGPRSDEALDA